MRSKLPFCLFVFATLWLPLRAEAASVCGNAVVEAGEQCDVGGGSFCCIGCQFQPTTTPCRASSGICDLEEFCTGASATCPSDGLEPSTTICRESPGSLNSQVQSTRGASDPLATGTVATASSNFQFRVGATGLLRTVTAGTSDSLQSFVNNVNALKTTAPAYQKVTASQFNSGSHCQADVPDNNSCLTNADCPASVSCATTYAVLLVSETRGADYSIIVETDETQLKFAVLREGSDDSCNPTEKCSGSSATCGSDVFQNASFVCRAEAGFCDIEEKCPNNPAGTCPGDAVKAQGTACRPSAGICDPAEVCSGNAASCPADAKSVALCRSSLGSCDPSETCDGSADDCPVDGIYVNGTLCRPSAGTCDTLETCDGANRTCPADGMLPNTTICRASAGQCDTAENCTGSATDCPADTLAPDGTACTDGDECTINDQCVAGVCGVDPVHCGDGVLQDNCGEECDDGNSADVDGCSSACVAEPGLGCAYFPLTGCRQSTHPHRSKINIRDEEQIGKLRFQWRWSNGEATTEADFGDPLTDAPVGTSYTLCAYDAGGLLVQATAPAGGSCGVLHPTACWKG